MSAASQSTTTSSRTSEAKRFVDFKLTSKSVDERMMICKPYKMDMNRVDGAMKDDCIQKLIAYMKANADFVSQLEEYNVPTKVGMPENATATETFPDLASGIFVELPKIKREVESSIRSPCHPEIASSRVDAYRSLLTVYAKALRPGCKVVSKGDDNAFSRWAGSRSHWEFDPTRRSMINDPDIGVIVKHRTWTMGTAITGDEAVEWLSEQSADDRHPKDRPTLAERSQTSGST